MTTIIGGFGEIQKSHITNQINSNFKENDIEKGLSPKNKYQKMIDFKWKDALQNKHFKDYVIKELYDDSTDNIDFDSISYTERERLLRDKDYMSKAENHSEENEPKENKEKTGITLEQRQKIIQYVKDNPKLDDEDFHEFLTNLDVNIHEGEEIVYEEFNIKLNKGENDLVGGKADRMTASEIAAKHSIPMELMKKQVDLGLKVEREHTSDPDEILEIVLDHLEENPQYYTQPKPKNWAQKEINVEKAINPFLPSIEDEIQKGITYNEGEIKEFKDGKYKYEGGHWKKVKEVVKGTDVEKLKNHIGKPVDFKGTEYFLHGVEDGKAKISLSPGPNNKIYSHSSISKEDTAELKLKEPKEKEFKGEKYKQGDKVSYNWQGMTEEGHIKNFNGNDFVIWNDKRSIAINPNNYDVKKVGGETKDQIFDKLQSKENLFSKIVKEHKKMRLEGEEPTDNEKDDLYKLSQEIAQLNKQLDKQNILFSTLSKEEKEAFREKHNIPSHLRDEEIQPYYHKNK